MIPAQVLAVLAGLLAVAAVAVAVRTRRAADVTMPAFWMPVAVAGWPAVVQVLQTVVGTTPGGVDGAQIATVVPMLVVGAVQIVVAVRRRASHTVGVAAVAATAVIALVAGASALAGQSVVQGLLASALALSVAVSGRAALSAVLSGIAATVCALVVLIAAGAVLFASAAVRTDCQQNAAKCDMLGGFVSIGGDSGSNAVGVTIAVLAGVAVFAAGARAAPFLVPALVLAPVASGARLATACAAVSALAGWAALHPRLRRPALATALVGGVAISLATALVPLPPDALTQRATLWARARDLVVESPLVGHGLSSWVRAAATSPPPTASYSPHNVWLEPAVAMGVGGVVVLVAVIGVGWALCRPEARTAVTLLLIGILVAGAFEATAMPVRIGPVPAGFPLLLLMLTAGQRDLSAVREIALPSRARPCR